MAGTGDAKVEDEALVTYDAMLLCHAISCHVMSYYNTGDAKLEGEALVTYAMLLCHAMSCHVMSYDNTEMPN